MRLYEFIPANMEEILREWEEFASDIWPGDLPNERIIRDHAEEMLNAVVIDMQAPQTDRQQVEKSIGGGTQSEDSKSMDQSSTRHAVGRVDSGFDLRALVSEYRALRASILRLWSREAQAGSDNQIEDVTRFNEAVDQLLAESIVSYTERLDHSREIFLGILGHDLRSPLNAVSMAGGLLNEQGELSDLSRKMSSQIVISTRAMERMITDLLDFTGTRLGAKMTLTRQPMDLGLLGQEVIAEIRAVHPSRIFTIETTGDGNGEWDPIRLRQLISNLVGNAVQHGSTAAQVNLFIDGTGESVVLGVRNEGKPIPRDSLALIFEPLRRNASDANRRPAGSIGLGLYIAREVATAHGGTIHVDSTEAGTIFFVRLPRNGDAAPIVEKLAPG